MSDRHLCKAKRTDNGEWVEGYYAFIDNVHYIYTGALCNGGLYVLAESFEIDPSTICRCTGLKDKKNNKLIWENDIAKHYNNSNLPEQYDIGVIQWDDIQLRFKRTSTMSKECVCINSSCVYEVIGNVFDNPELLRHCFQPSNKEWIPCSEKLPPTGIEVLVCHGFPNDKYFAIAKIIEYPPGKKYWNIKSTVYAWQPLPEMYVEK